MPILSLLLFLVAVGCGASQSTPAPGERVVASADAEAPPSFHYQRLYAPGTTYRLQTQRRYIENHKLKYVETAVSAHAVLDGSPPRERISFESLIRTTGDSKQDLSAEIGTFPAYEASIAAGAAEGSLDLPSLKDWDLGTVGVVTDLHTFLVAISPHAGIDKVSVAGESSSLPEATKASWANDDDIPVGEDCIQISIRLREIRDDTAIYESSFLPPDKECLDLMKPWMAPPVVEGSPNNFQQKMRMGESFGAMWGREQFVILSTVRRADGMLLHATMVNDLALRLKVGCDQELETCQHEMPLELRRELTVNLLNDDRQPVPL